MLSIKLIKEIRDGVVRYDYELELVYLDEHFFRFNSITKFVRQLTN